MKNINEVASRIKAAVGNNPALASAEHLRSGTAESVFNPAMEGYAPDAMATVNAITTDWAGIGREAMDWSGLTPAQRKAFEIASVGCNDIVGYNRMASRVSVAAESQMPTSRGEYYLESGHEITAAIEAYDQRSVTDAKVATIVVNTAVAKQDDFAEAFYPTETLAPNQGNVQLKIQTDYIMKDYLHTGTGFGGVEPGFGSVNFIDAIINPDILHDASTKIIPLYNKSNPVFSTEVGTWKEEGLETGALKFNVPIDLLTVSFDATLNPSQVADSTDQLDTQVKVGRLFVKFTKGGKSEVFEINTSELMGAQFAPLMSRSASRDLALNFNSTAIPFAGDTKTIANKESELLEYLRDPARKDWVMYLDVTVGGNVNLETGSIRVNKSDVTIDSIWDAPQKEDGTCHPQKIIKATELNSLKDKFDSIELVGWYPEARRTNLNRRNRGLLVRTDYHVEHMTIPMGPPVSALTPLVEVDTLINLEAPVRAVRAMNSQNALLKLIAYGDTLARWHNSTNHRSPRPDIEGIGRHVIRPYYDHKEIDMIKLVDSLESKDHVENTQWAIMNVIRSMVTAAWSRSNYGPAWQATGMSGKPVVLIGCNSEIASYLNLRAETRYLGDLFDVKVVSTNCTAIGDRIIAVLTTKSDSDEKSYLFRHGNFFFMPEIVSTAPKTTNGGQSVQLTVQNRNLHINYCPIQLRLTLKNLTKAFLSKIPVRTVTEIEGVVETHPNP